MESISQSPITDRGELLRFTLRTLLPLLEEKRAEIEKIQRKTFRFGDLERNQLDVYYPPTPGKAPVLFFVYGGGFTTGDRILEGASSLIYANMGSFFARRGFLTVIADYRLAPEVKYPASAEDIRDAIAWVIGNASSVASADVKPDVDSIFLFGQSAGAAHVSTLLFDKAVLAAASERILPRVRGVVLCGGPYTFKSASNLSLLAHYYGTPEETARREPLGLLEDASSAHLARLPDIFFVSAEHDLREILLAKAAFKPAIESRFGKEIPELMGRQHNHFSVVMAPGSGVGEEYCEDVVNWMRERLG
ncbi:hypothetical protein PLICRDRAFT_55506 [Plicaturopsis crispa FD-325 SS-3]|nr:hypothetical protein PLICRDRAFT_55506 [Plicaturopsis crispa FD-325 SS-3]